LHGADRCTRPRLEKAVRGASRSGTRSIITRTLSPLGLAHPPEKLHSLSLRRGRSCLSHSHCKMWLRSLFRLTASRSGFAMTEIGRGSRIRVRALTGSSGKSPYPRDGGDAWRPSRPIATPPSPHEGMAMPVPVRRRSLHGLTTAPSSPIAVFSGTANEAPSTTARSGLDRPRTSAGIRTPNAAAPTKIAARLSPGEPGDCPLWRRPDPPRQPPKPRPFPGSPPSWPHFAIGRGGSTPPRRRRPCLIFPS
jgi:hypothetical protein